MLPMLRLLGKLSQITGMSHKKAIEFMLIQGAVARAFAGTKTIGPVVTAWPSCMPTGALF
jgi:hypothetical protein